MVRRLFAQGHQPGRSQSVAVLPAGSRRDAPAFIVTADHDPMRDEGNEYAAKLKAANVPIDYTCWPGIIHGLASFAGVLDAGKLLINQTASALRDAFLAAAQTPR